MCRSGVAFAEPPARLLQGVAVRVLVFGAQAPAVLGKLRSSVLARRHAPATPESAGAARAAPQEDEHEDDDDESADDRRLKEEKRARGSSQTADRRRAHAVAWTLFHLSLRASGARRRRAPPCPSAVSRPARRVRVDERLDQLASEDDLEEAPSHRGVPARQVARAEGALSGVAVARFRSSQRAQIASSSTRLRKPQVTA
jgi:hypothetical protein